MAFRPPREQQQGVPSLGYRLSSNRQPGIEQSNNMMPDYKRIGDEILQRRNEENQKKLEMENYTKNIREQNKIKKKNQERNQIGCLLILFFLIIIFIFIF